jgi:LmbE family N-acetylglucosaminyl deacetylase
MSDKKTPTVMAVGAHHDDNELVAGTLALYRRAGRRVVSVVVTDGRVIDGKSATEHVEIRERESREAAAMLDMQCEFLRVPEAAAEPNADTRAALVRLLREHQPTIVVTHPPHDYHLDHMWVSRSVFEAVHQCWNAGVQPQLTPCPRPKLYYGDAWFVHFEPDRYVDIQETIELKRRMLGCHQSQWPGGPSDSPSMLDLAVLQNRFRGAQANCTYAEGFRLASGFGGVCTSVLPD